MQVAFEPHRDSEVCMCREVLVMVMRKHQRYFPVYDNKSNLMPVFITVANGSIDEQTVVEGAQQCFSCLLILST